MGAGQGAGQYWHVTGTKQNSQQQYESGGGGTDRFTLRYAHTRTHKRKRDKLHFLPKLRPSVTSVHASRGRDSCGRLASAFLRILHTSLRQACVGEGPSPETLAKFRILAVVGRNTGGGSRRRRRHDGRRSGGRSARDGTC